MDVEAGLHKNFVILVSQRTSPSTAATPRWSKSRLAAAALLGVSLVLVVVNPLIGAAPWAALAGAMLAFVSHPRPAPARTRLEKEHTRTRAVTSPPRVSVVIPALNEAENLRELLPRLPGGLHEVILVDGGSEDDTVAVALEQRPSIRVVHQSDKGKGDALRLGFEAVTGDAIVMLDADGSANPAEIPRFIDSLWAGADFAKGSRFIEGGGSEDITPLRRAGNWGLATSVNLLYGTRYSDLCYGYNAFWTRCLPYISLDVTGFEVETLINVRLAKAGLVISEVPSYELNRIHGQSHLRTFRDGFRVLRTIIRESWLNPGMWQRRPETAITLPAAVEAKRSSV